ncbi:MAG: YjfB family protein [Lachnospiraceae bacterium]|nr:YjfB family protein [Lachnospiraceae bacterium]
MDFSITQLSPAISQANLSTDYGVAMLAKTMDNNEQIGQNLVNMIDTAAMERSVNPAVGGNFDMSV